MQLKVLSSPFLKNFAVLDDETIIASLVKKNVDLDRPISIGAAILGENNYTVIIIILVYISERSKAVMFSYLYEILYPFFGRKGCIPLYTGILH